MADIAEVLQALDGDALIEMFEVDFATIPGASGVVRFHAGANALEGDLVWQGVTYSRFPVKVSGYDKQTRGGLARPRLSIFNATQAMTPALIAHDDLVGAKVTRRRTFARFLDAVNFPNGNLFANPTQSLPDDIHFIDQKAKDDGVDLEFILVASLDLTGFKLPSEVVSQSICPFGYRRWTGAAWDHSQATECSYTGAACFKVDGSPTADPAQDVCSKSLSACALRHSPLRFGGFPAARNFST